MVRVLLLGTIRVMRGDVPVEGGWRRKALELLAYLSVHPHGVARDQILEALWPEGDPRQTQEYLWHTVSRLRNRLRGSGVSRVVERVDDMYRFDFGGLWVDVVEFQSLVARARDSEDPREALKSACDIYKGEFCEGRYFGWATVVREQLRALFIQASRALAESLERQARYESALAVLERATRSDPYDEGLARKAIKIEAHLGRRDLAVRRFRRLRRLLIADLGVEVSDATHETVRQSAGPNSDSAFQLLEGQKTT